MKNKLSDLRNNLFMVIERLMNNDPENPMNCETAETIVKVSRSLLDTAEIELAYIRHRDNTENAHPSSSEFIDTTKLLEKS